MGGGGEEMCTYLFLFTSKVHSLLKAVKRYDVPSTWCPCKVRRKTKNFQYDKYELAFFYSFTCWFCLFFFFFRNSVDGVFLSSETQGQSVGSGERARRKFFKYGRKSPRVPTLTELFPKIQADAGSWLGTKSALYYSAQSANSSPWVLFMSSYTTVIVLPHLPGSFTKLVRERETFIFYFPNQKLGRNYRWVEKTFGMLLAGAIEFAPRIFCFWHITMYRK